MAPNLHAARSCIAVGLLSSAAALAQTGALAPPQTASMKMPTADEVALFRVEPELISVLDYTQGFGHTDLVACQAH